NGSGSQYVSLNDYVSAQPGPADLRLDSGGYSIDSPDNHFWGNDWDNRTYNGVIVRALDPGWLYENRAVVRAKVTSAGIVDGTSNTMMVGEKFVPLNWRGGQWWADDDGPIEGWDPDIARSTVNCRTYFPLGNPTRDTRLDDW